MLIHLQAQIMHFTTAIAMAQNTDFIETPIFKNEVMPMLKAALLNPGVWAYVNGLGTYILRVMKASVMSWKIPPLLVEDKKVLTDFCGHMKKMIHQSTLDKSSIWELGINIASKDYILDDAHFVRFAFG
ncbi:hypothetical protein K439DRAFT_1624538 [Ramaria rubella]|nr:hypothetical protein K439DRAFT_1624538 [Ramaria rubella]